MHKELEKGIEFLDAVCSAAIVAFSKDVNQITYKFFKDFSQELFKVKINVKSNHLFVPSKPTLIEVPEGLLRFEEGTKTLDYTQFIVGSVESQGVYYVALSKDKPCLGWVSFMGLDSAENPDTNFLHSLAVNPSSPQRHYEIYRFIINALAYIASGDPDLREAAPAPRPSNFKGKQKEWVRANRGAPVILVGFGYKKPPIRHVGEAEVVGHFRWQPWGPERSKIKLVWIEQHIRKYKKPNISL